MPKAAEMATPDHVHAVGRRVLAALAAGRSKVNSARRIAGANTALAVRDLERAEERLGRPRRGRAKRIALALNLSERHVARILDALSSRSEKACDSPVNKKSPEKSPGDKSVDKLFEKNT